MKIKRLFLTGLTLAILLLIGCSKDNIETYRGPEQSQIAVSIPGTKLSSTAPWAVKSKIGAFTTNLEGKGGVNRNAELTVQKNGFTDADNASFEGMFGIATPMGNNKIYAYFPYTLITSVTSHNAVPLTLPTSQIMTGDSYDSRCGFMYANGDLGVTAKGKGLNFNCGTLEFKPVVGFIKLLLKGITAGTVIADKISEDDAVINVSVMATAETSPKLAGGFTFNLATGVADFGTADGTGNRVQAECPSDMTLGGLSAWVAVNPFSVSGDTETIEVKIDIGTCVLKKEIMAKDLASSDKFEVTAGKTSNIEVTIDDTWDVENNVPGKVQGLYLAKNNVGPHTLTIGWEETNETLRTYVAQIFADKNGSPLYTTPTLTFITNNTLYSSASNEGKGPVRFTFTELQPGTTYYMRVKHSLEDDIAYSDFITGKTESAHVPTANEVFYQGFDKYFWGSDPINSAIGVYPNYVSGNNPAGFDNLNFVVATNANVDKNLTSYEAFDTDYFGTKGWRNYASSTASAYISPGYIKLGSGSLNGNLGTIEMGSALPADGTDCILTFKACPYVIKPEGTAAGLIQVFVVHADAAPGAEPTNVTNIMTISGNKGLNSNDSSSEIFIGIDDRTANYRWTERRFELPGLKSTDRLWFKSVGTNYRFLLDEIKVVTIDAGTTPLNTPIVTFDDNLKTSEQLKATWGVVSRAASYTVAWKKSSDVSFTEVAGITATEYLMTNLETETEYEVKVKAIAAMGGADSQYSTIVKSITSSNAQAKLSTPTNVEASSEFSTATITWDSVEDANGYAISVDGTQVGTVGAVMTYAASNLDFGKEYTIAVKALAGGSQYDSDYSTDIKTTTKDLFPVTKHISPHTLTFGWEKASATTYEVQIFADKAGAALHTVTGVTWSTHAMFAEETDAKGPLRFTFTELTADTKYYMRVKNTGDDDSAYSKFIEATTQSAHAPVAGEVFYQGFDKLFWGSDPVNSASGTEPSFTSATVAAANNPIGWSLLTVLMKPETASKFNITGTMVIDNFGLNGWTYEKTNIYSSPGYIKLGSGSVNGDIITPAMGDGVLSAGGDDCILTFKACPFVTSGDATIAVSVLDADGVVTNVLTFAANSGLNTKDESATGGAYIGTDTQNIAGYKWTTRTFEIPGLKPTDKIKFKSVGTAYRFLLDDIQVVKK